MSNKHQQQAVTLRKHKNILRLLNELPLKSFETTRTKYF